MSTEDLSLLPPERRLALVIGVNEAPHSHLEPLNYAVNDAEAVAQVLQEHCGFTLLLPPLLGVEATSANVRKAVLALARQRTDADFLLLYFSGHGQPMTVSGDQSDIYLATSDFSESETEEDETLHCSMRWLQEKLYLPTQAGKVLLVLDCCYAGNMGRTASDPYLEDLKARINKYFGAPGSASGARSGGLRLALTATGHNQSAYEQDGHGTMTGWLLECLQGKIDEVIDLDNRGNVSLQRLHDYLLRVMPANQNPSVAGDYAGRNCILAQYEQRANELRQQKRAIVNERPHTHIPLARSTSFQRRSELETFARLLFAQQVEISSSHAIIVGLIGMGGIGKTQLAVEIAYEYKERFPGGVFWTPAIGISLSEWQRQFAELAANTDYLPPGDDVSHPENEARRARHICRYLAQHPDALLLLDNVEHIEDLLDALTTFASEEVQCTILYTSRTNLAPPNVQKYSVGKLSDEGALHLLLARRSVLLKRILSGERDPEGEAAREICHYVEGLPLALILLRDLLQDTHLTLAHLQQELGRRGMLDITSNEDVTKARLFSTFFLSWEKVRNPDAQRFFKLASYFPEASPISLWLLALATNLQGNTSLEPLGKARLELLRWSLIEELPNDAIRLHPLVREFAQRLVALDAGRETLLAEARERLTHEFTNVNKLEQRILDEGYWQCLERVQEVVKYGKLLGIKQADVLERVEYWLARDSSLLGTGTLWPEVLPGLFYQQLHNHALEEGYQLPGTQPDARWICQLARIGAEDQALLREFRHPAGVTIGRKRYAGVTSVAFSPDGHVVLTGCEDCSVRVWNADSGQLVQVLQGHDSPITGVAFSPDGSMIVTCSLDTDMRLWNALSGQSIRVFDGEKYALRDVTFSPDGKYVAAKSNDRSVRIWEVATGEVLAMLVVQSYWIGGFVFSADSEQIATISFDSIEIWERESGQLVATLKDKGGSWSWGWNVIDHLGIAFSPDRKSLLFGSQDTIHIWEIGQQGASMYLSLDRFSFPTKYITGTAFSSDNKQIAVIRDTMLEVLQIQNKQIVLSFEQSTTITSVAFSPDSTKVVTGSYDGVARIWQISFVLPTERDVQPYFEPIACAMFSPTGMQLLTAGITEDIASDRKKSYEGVVRVFHTQDGEIVRTLQEGSGFTSSMALSPDGKRVAIGKIGTILIWDTEQNQEITRYPPSKFTLHYEMSRCLAFSPDKMHLATAADQIVQIWMLDTWEKIALLRGHEGVIKQMIFSPDGSRLVTGATDGTVRIWEIPGGTQLVVLKEYAGRGMCISSDGQRVATASFSDDVHISSMTDGKRLMTLEGHTQPITTLSFSPSGRYLLSADQSGQVFFWHVEVDRKTTRTPWGVYIAGNEIVAVYWQDEQHVILADRGGTNNHPHFYHLTLEGAWEPPA